MCEEPIVNHVLSPVTHECLFIANAFMVRTQHRFMSNSVQTNREEAWRILKNWRIRWQKNKRNTNAFFAFILIYFRSFRLYFEILQLPARCGGSACSRAVCNAGIEDFLTSYIDQKTDVKPLLTALRALFINQKSK